VKLFSSYRETETRSGATRSNANSLIQKDFVLYPKPHIKIMTSLGSGFVNRKQLAALGKRRTPSRARLVSVVAALLLLVGVNAARADLLVLVHGMLADGSIWRYSGVSDALEAAGWKDAGEMQLNRQPAPAPAPASSFYTVTFNTLTSLTHQAEALHEYLRALRRQAPHEPIFVAGHSAGGVVARLLMVEHPDLKISGLITFSSPHLGADTALLGRLAGENLLVWLEPWLGRETSTQIGTLIDDLSPENSANLLGWLNHQSHPEAAYVSVVRESDNMWDDGDLFVPKHSQDLTQVTALRGRARTVYAKGNHALSHADGELLARLLDTLRQI
jgi:triacylglycerol lipase